MSPDTLTTPARPDREDGSGSDPGERLPAAAQPAGPEARRPRRRWILAASGIATALLVGGGVAVARSAGRGQDTAGGDAATAINLATVAVERRSLEEHTDLDGTLGYGDATQVSLAAQGTITDLAPIGSVVEQGETLLEVDGKPVPLLYGERPLWRPLGPDVDDGADVEQLEANMVALGIVTESELTVDQEWTDATTDAVEEWQESLGLEETGAVAPGDVVFRSGAVRVAEHPNPVGGQAGGGPVLGVTGSTRVVTVDLEANSQDLVEPGQAVDLVLPDGTETTGTVYSVGDVATSASSGDEDGGTGDGGGDTEATIEVVIALEDPEAGGRLDQAPATVRVVTSAAEDVLAVPVEALLALAEGGYAVDLVDGDGTTSLTAVELGAFADGWVEITGDVAEGDEVVIPRD